MNVPLNFASTNDIIGGNSGSPVINKNAEITGLIFDGNIHSLGGAYGYDGELNRSVAVHSSGILEALQAVYGANRIVTELNTH
jgi:V8-like Glu-specific endopeptidase